MNQYHIRASVILNSENKWKKIDYYRFNLDETTLIQEIVNPHLKKKPISLDGSKLEHSEFLKIQIYLTPERAEYYASGSRGAKWNALASNGIDVTIDYIIHNDNQKTLPNGEKVLRPPLTKNIFIVHGRDLEPMKELKSMISEFGLNPIVLHEQASEGMTIAEKLEKHTKDVGFAFVLLTPDDRGASRPEIQQRAFKANMVSSFSKLPMSIPSEPLFCNFRARQNVIFEMGYFWGLLNRTRVCCLYKGDVELPSDMHGIVYVQFKDSVKERQNMIIKELKVAGYELKI